MTDWPDFSPPPEIRDPFAGYSDDSSVAPDVSPPPEIRDPFADERGDDVDFSPPPEIRDPFADEG